MLTLAAAHRAATPQEKLQRVADGFRVPYADMITDANKVARSGIDLMALETLLSLGELDATLVYLDKAVVLSETPFRVAASSKVSKLNLSIMNKAGNATRCDMGGPKTAPKTTPLKLTPADKKVLREYSGSWEMAFDDGQSDEWNKALRSGRSLSDLAHRLFNSLNSVIAKSELVADTVLYRGANVKAFSKLKVGTTFSDQAFLSTTSDRKVAMRFAEDAKGKPTGTMFVINARKGTKAIDMDKLLGKRGVAEAEFLLQKGQKFKVIKIDKNIITVDLQ